MYIYILHFIFCICTISLPLLMTIYLKNPISLAGHTITLPWVCGMTCMQETTFNPSILLPGVAPPTTPPIPLLKHSVCKRENK